MSLTEEDKNWIASTLRTEIRQSEERTANLIAAEVGNIHQQIQDMAVQIQDMDRRIKRIDTNTLSAFEMIARQARWHEQSDNAIADGLARQNELARALQEIRARLDKLEKAS